MKLNEILALLKIPEKGFVSMSEETWEKTIKERQQDNPQAFSGVDMSYLVNLKKKDDREMLFVNNLLEKSSTPQPPATPPVMGLEQIYSLLNINRASFLTMQQEDWNKNVKDAMLNQPFTNDQQAFLIDKLANIDQRQQFFVNNQPLKYMPLPKIIPGNPAHTEMLKEQNPVTLVNAQGYNSGSLYMLAGDKPAKIEENKQSILEAYKKYIENQYDNLSPEKQSEYGSKEKFLNNFKEKETYFKSFEALEQSDLFKHLTDDSKVLYKSQKGAFPIKIVSLPFEHQTDGKEFMESLIVKSHIKPMPPVFKEQKKEKEEAELPTSSSLPGASANN